MSEADPQAREAGPSAGPTPEAIQSSIVAVLKTVYDPEIPVDIYELGLIYSVDIAVDEGGEAGTPKNVSIVMTLTSPMCPVVESLPAEVQDRVSSLDGLESARVDLVWEPPWTPERNDSSIRVHTATCSEQSRQLG